jgi:biopolymer transport protein ExbB
MIQSFNVVSTASGASAAPAITGGVAEALIATATGLAVAIVTLPVYNHLTETVREVASTLERRATEFQNAASDLSPVLAAPLTKPEGNISHATAANPA